MAGDTEQDRLSGLGFEIKDPQRFAENMGRLMEETGKAVAAWMEPRLSGERPLDSPDEAARMMRTFAEVQQAWLKQPHKLMEAYGQLWTSHFQLWTSSMQRLFGAGEGEDRAAAASDRKDVRFKDPALSEGIFDYMKQAYLITSNWSEHLVDEAEGLDPDTRQ